MKYTAEATLAGGQVVLLRSLSPQDAQEMIRVCKKAAGETDFMMRYADEWTITPDKQRQVLADTEHAPRALMLGAFIGGALVGAGNFRPSHPADRARHRAEMGLSILKSHWHMGVGSAMLQAMIDAARSTPLEQLELSVAAGNARAKALYDRFGFAEYGRLPRGMKYRDGRYDDLILMMLELHRGS